MIDASPVAIRAEHDALQSLATDLVGYALEDDRATNSRVWLLRRSKPALLVTSTGHDIVHKFEVFTLAVRTRSKALAMAGATSRHLKTVVVRIDAWGEIRPSTTPAPDEPRLEPRFAWPFDRWEVSVLWKREWIMSAEAAGEDWPGEPLGPPFSVVPLGAEHACLVATGLLFTGLDGRRLLIEQGEMPLDLLVTQDTALIDKSTISSFAMPLSQYLAGLTPPV